MKIQRNSTTWLFDPFTLVAGAKSLLLGVSAIGLAAWIGSLSNTHFDGVLDTHTGVAVPLWVYFGEAAIDWLSLSITVGITAMCFSKSRFRWLDVLGTQALARWPTVLMALLCLPEAYGRFGMELLKNVQDPAALTKLMSGPDAVVFFTVVIGVLLLTMWMVYLMYKAFSVSCNMRGGKAIGLFIGALLLAEILSKVLIGQLFHLI